MLVLLFTQRCSVDALLLIGKAFSRNMQKEWKFVKVLPPLAQNIIQIWRIELSSDERLMTGYRHYLSDEENRRAERRLPGRVRAEFVIGRACLRILLAHALGAEAREIEFEESAYGKPKLRSTLCGPSFNVSHSKGTILLALGNQGHVGIDTEHIDPRTDIAELAPSVCSPQELKAIMSWRNDDEQRLSFYRCWTRKEAIIKADGRGLSLPLTGFEVQTDSAANFAVMLEGTGKSYYLSDIALGAGIVGALATDSPNCRMSMLHFPLSVLEAHPVQKQ
jgi:4'-phosphopantetheinyl transferase